MSEIITFPTKAKPSRRRPEGQGTILVQGPSKSGDPWYLAQVEDHGDHVIVRAAMPGQSKARKYVVDTMIEGMRLAYRVHGFHSVRIRQQGPHAFHVEIPPAVSGSDVA